MTREAARALSFDLDGTLLDGSRLGESIADTCQAIAARELSLDAARLVEANSEVWADYYPLIEDDWALGVLDGVTVSLEAWRRTLKACGSTDESLVRFAYETFAALEGERQQLFDDVMPLISELRDRGLPLALVTNGASDTQRGRLRVLGIEDWFQVVVVSGEIGIIKPDPAVFESVLEAFEVDPGSVWHIGDWPLTDVAGANAAGLTSVWLNRRGRSRQDKEPVPHIEIRSLTDLGPLMR